MKRTIFYLSLLTIILFSCNNSKSEVVLVKNMDELNAAITNAKAGDELILANGIWKDVEIKFVGKGTKEYPILLKAETAGEVFIEGVSNLEIGGEYLEVNGLHFRNGYTPTKNVIQFKIDSDNIAKNCKVTNCVIEEFTQPERDIQDHWVEFWGRNNELSNCYIAGKSNSGPTVMVVLKGNESINTHHQIVNNYFGPRPRKGGPHGETLQIGDSGTSMAPAYVNVANNYFDRNNGEVEIVSNKSNFNVFKNNIFFESEGSLVLRHGNYVTINGNIFIGNDNSEFIGGIRVINTGHWITNNYFYKIKGNEFRSALAVMNGVPKSPLNRYNQVTDAVIAYNSFIDCESPWQFSVGANNDKSDVLPASEIRSARPIRTILANNVIFNHKADEYPIVNYDKVDGVTFKNNSLNSTNKSEVTSDGLITKNMEMTQLSDWLYVPITNDAETYAGFDFETITTDLFGNLRTNQNSAGAITVPANESNFKFDKKAYGPIWFSSEKEKVAAITVNVSNVNELVDAVSNVASETILELNSGVYELSKSLNISSKVTIKSKDENNKAKLLYNGEANTPAFQMQPKGILTLEGVNLQGTNEQQAIAPLEKGMSKAYNLWLKNTNISDFKDVLKTYKNSFADTISIVNSTFKNCENGIQLAGETDDKGEYSAEFVYIQNSEFDNVKNNVLNYYRGGYDESTIGGNLVFENNKLTNCGKNDTDGVLLNTRGIVNLTFKGNTFTNNPVKLIAILWGEKGQKSVDNILINSGKIEVQQNLKMKLMY
tara:strand:- start:492 stop:2801 length:2310 start_codon:yes stop_codon:yes gene_type:complete